MIIDQRMKNMKLEIDTSKIDVNDVKQLDLLRIFSLFHYSKTYKVLYTKMLNKDITLPTSDFVLILFIHGAYLAECALQLKRLIDNGIYEKKDTWYPVHKESWDFLFSNDGLELQKKLRSLRNKSVFHVDPEMIKNYCAKFEEKEILIQFDDEHQFGYSPFVVNAVTNWFGDDLDLISDDNVKLFDKIHYALDHVIAAIFFDFYGEAITVERDIE